MSAVLVVDWGASSIRVARVTAPDGGPMKAQIVHRHHHRPVRDEHGSLRWDWDRLMAETDRGLAVGLAMGPVESIGVDSWGVDYGLLDARGTLVGMPFSYRDARTDGWRTTLDRIGADVLYVITGVQAMPFNTIFQLACHRDDELRRAATVLMLPDLIVYELCGHVATERTAAGTSGLLDLATGSWSQQLSAAIGLAPSLLAPIAEPGTLAGTWRGIPVRLVGSHDTASAVVGGGRPDRVFVSAGTWYLVGMERATPDLSPAAQAANFTNEQSTYGGVRFLRNVAGGWLLDECARSWGPGSLASLADEVAQEPVDVPIFDATDDALVAPADMPATVCRLAGLAGSASRATVVRCVVESTAATVATIADRLDATGVAGIDLFGGGARSAVFVDALRRRSGREVAIGHPEATVVGNALTQFVASGRFRTLADARAHVPAGD